MRFLGELGLLDAEVFVNLYGLMDAGAVVTGFRDLHVTDILIGVRVNAQLEDRVDERGDAAQFLVPTAVGVSCLIEHSRRLLQIFKFYHGT